MFDDDFAVVAQQVFAVVAIARGFAIIIIAAAVIVIAVDAKVLELVQALGQALEKVALAREVGLGLLSPGVHLNGWGVVLEPRQKRARVFEVLDSSGAICWLA